LKPREAFRLHPGFVSFVPQQIQIIDGSILENLSLGLPMVETDAARAWDVLADVGLSEFVNELPGKLTAQLGENGSRLSGGQRQKIGIARALLTRPGLLILDEATSSMDSESEQGITAAIDNLQEKCSLIVVAHRLATLKNLKRIMIIEDGTIGSIGTFNELKEESAVFRKMLKENNFDL
jgi:ABC-type bacteriocin/lantibiotic exporter with double-glycine peptidase domain